MRSSRFEEACAVSVLMSLFALAWGQPDVVIDTTIQLQRDRIVVGTVQTLTTFANESELSADANGATFLQGFRFWVDQTNQQGGITLGTRKVQVELAYYDDQGDSEKAVECYKRLLEQKGAHFIFGGGVLGTDALLGVANSSNILTMLTQESKYSEGWHPLLFDMHSRPGPDILPEVSDFLFGIAEAHNFTRLLFFFTRENPLAASPCISAVEHARSSGRFSSATAINQTAPWLWKDHITRHRPEILIACTDTSNEVEFVMNELVSQRILYGWDTSAQDWYNPTVVESTTSLNFAFFMRGAGTSDFFATAKGWSNFVSGSVAWAPQLGYTDPYFGDSVRTNQVFKARGDFGDGRDMHPRAAAAVGAGVVLQLAIEAAQSVESGAVAAAMRGLDQETVYGQVRFDERQQNVGHHSAMFQWQCDHQADYLTSASNLIPCKQKIVHPFERATGLLRLLPKACPQNQIHTELLAVFEDPEDAIYTLDYEIDDLGGVIEILQEDVLEGTEAAGCEYCVTANPKLIEDLKQHGGDNAVSLGDACRVFRDTVSVGALFTSHTDAATISALLYARQVVVDSLEILPNIPLHLSFVESSTLLEGNATLIADSLRSVVVEAEATAPRTGFVWSSGQAATMQDYVPEIFTHVTGVEGARNLESKTMFTWGNTSVSIVPAIFQQGRGLFRLVEHFGWNRCRLIRGSEPAFQAMGDKFVSSAAELGDQITVFQDILIPAVSSVAPMSYARARRAR